MLNSSQEKFINCEDCGAICFKVSLQAPFITQLIIYISLSNNDNDSFFIIVQLWN